MKRMICMLLCAVLLLSGCTGQQYRTPGTFYYHRTETTYSGTDGVCAPEVRELHGIDSDLDAVLELYCAGPISADLNNPLPPDAQVLSWELTEGVLTLNFSESLSRLSGIELTVAAACLARTFLELTGAQTCNLGCFASFSAFHVIWTLSALSSTGTATMLSCTAAAIDLIRRESTRAF